MRVRRYDPSENLSPDRERKQSNIMIDSEILIKIVSVISIFRYHEEEALKWIPNQSQYATDLLVCWHYKSKIEKVLKDKLKPRVGEDQNQNSVMQCSHDIIIPV